jgi:cystathionine beta-lyase
MKYDFDNVSDRRGTFSYKWDNRKAIFPGNPEAFPMWVADTDFPCPTGIAEAIRERAEHPIFGYSFIDGESAALVADCQKKRNNWDVDPEWVAYCNGIVPALSAMVAAFSEPGQGVIIQPPVYYPFKDAIVNNGRVVQSNELRFDGSRWIIDFENLEKLAAEPDNKLLILCNPHNPVSRVYGADELCRIGEICLRYGVIIASDEIHSDLIYPGSKHIPIASLSKEIGCITITAMSPSKSFNIAGLQISALIVRIHKFSMPLGRDGRQGYIPACLAQSH